MTWAEYYERYDGWQESTQYSRLASIKDFGPDGSPSEEICDCIQYVDGKRVKHTVKPVLGERAAHNGKVVYSLDFEVTPHLLRHTYITNLIHASVDPKTVQYLAGHENSKITMDIYAKAKYNRPDELAGILEDTFTLWDAE